MDLPFTMLQANKLPWKFMSATIPIHCRFIQTFVPISTADHISSHKVITLLIQLTVHHKNTDKALVDLQLPMVWALDSHRHTDLPYLDPRSTSLHKEDFASSIQLIVFVPIQNIHPKKTQSSLYSVIFAQKRYYLTITLH